MDEFPYAFKQSLPVVFAYFPLGMVFGVLFAHQGYDWYLAPLMSALVYAGAVQFLALTMMEHHATVLAIVVAAFFVAFRNTFYGISFFERFKPAGGFQKLCLIFGLVDGSYAIFLANPKASLRFCTQVNIILYLSWFVGTFLGAVFADHIPEIKGLDFVLTSFFMVLVIDYFMKYRQWAPLIFPVIASFISYLILPTFYFLIAIIASLCFIVCRSLRKGDAK